MKSNELLHALKKFVLIKSGLRNIDPAHCKNISEYIFQDTKNYISETTIKRFFGFASTQHKFSLYTLNSLAQYIGYKDWSAFSKENEVHEETVQSVWQDLRLRAQAITSASLTVKKNNSGIPFIYTSKRNFFYPDFEFFLNNSHQFTTISAPPGQGKSILIAHMIEQFFYSDEDPSNNDIVLLINSATIRTIIQSELSHQDWLYNQLKFKSVGELFSYLNKHPDERIGRFILIFDGIDEFLSKSNYQKIFVDFLHSIEENSFFKIILGLRTNSWANLQPVISESAFLTKAWYNGLFFDRENQVNIPALSHDEILSTLSKIEDKPISLSEVNSRLLKQFQTPFWLQIYYILKKENKNLDLKNPVLCYELVSYYLDQKVFMAQKSTEKIFLLKK